MTVAEWLIQHGYGPQLEKVPQELLNAKLNARIQVGNTVYRPGKYLRQLKRYLPLTEQDEKAFYADVEKYSLEFGLAYGEDLLEVYASRTVLSCMTGMNSYLSFYAANPEVVGVAWAKRNGTYVARSLVWNGKYYDRVYGADGHTSRALEEYLLQRGFTRVPREHVVPMRPSPTGAYPYIDTLYRVYVARDSDYYLLSGRQEEVLEWNGKNYVLTYEARSTSGCLFRTATKPLCVICGRPGREADSDGLFYCVDHAAHLHWVLVGGRVLYQYRESLDGLVRLSNGYYAPEEETALLLDGERVHLSNLPEGYVRLEAGVYAGCYAPKWRTTDYNGLRVRHEDIVDGKLVSLKLDTPVRTPPKSVIRKVVF